MFGRCKHLYMNITKACTACEAELPLSSDYFRKQSGTKDGFQYECVRCTSLRANVRYTEKPEVLEKNKQWQQNNKEKHNEIAKRYYNSPTGRLNRGLNKALNDLFTRARESFFHFVGTSPSALAVHLSKSLPKGMTMEDYQSKWFVGFVREPKDKDLKTEEGRRAAFNWENLCIKEKGVIEGDFGVKVSDDN